VILYILLVGYPPFYGPKDYQTRCILDGKYQFHEDRWAGVSESAKVRAQLLSYVSAVVPVNLPVV
jgi:hypothetical protein